MQLVRSLLVTGLILITLNACGGSSVPPAVQQQSDDQLQPTENPSESPEPDDGEPEDVEPPGTTVTFTGASQPVELPLFDPRLYEPGDREIPDLLLFNVAAGETLHGLVLISTTSVDDTGTNYIALLVDGGVRAETEDASLTYGFDTTGVENGPHLLEFVVRDNGNHIGVLTLNVTVDNASDWEPPTLDIVVTHCYYDETDFTPVTIYRDRNGGSFYADAAGIIDFEIRAADPSGVKRIELYYWEDGHQFADRKFITFVTDDYLPYSYDSTEAGYSRRFQIIAEDNQGNVGQTELNIHQRNSLAVQAHFTDASGEPLEDVDFYLMPRTWDDTQEFDTQLALDHAHSFNHGFARIATAPVGRNWFVAVNGEELLTLFVTTTPDHESGYLPEELTRFE
jgi:hypothetical protein